jgi:serine/threonine protein kinase
MSAVPVAKGDLLAGKYVVDRVLSAGNRSTVVSAVHRQLEQRVAIKVLLEDALESPEIVERFVREARATVKIKSQHVARVVDVGKLDSGAPFIVMEYLEGQHLADRIATRGPLAVEEAVELVLQACEALAEAHVLGIVHRDLKPANLFLTRSAGGLPIVKVLDFGISKVAGPSGVRMGMTRTTNVMGSPYYMSPEQLACTRDTDARLRRYHRRDPRRRRRPKAASLPGANRAPAHSRREASATRIRRARARRISATDRAIDEDGMPHARGRERVCHLPAESRQGITVNTEGARQCSSSRREFAVLWHR